MTALLGFLVFLAVTLVLLGVAVVSGRAAKRIVHLPCVASAVLCLLVTIYFAEQLGESYDLEASGWMYPLHLFLAKSTTVLYLAPICTGIHTLRHPMTRKLHGRVAWSVLVMTVLTAVTGTLMVYMSEPL